MSQSFTRYIPLSKINGNEELASIVIRLMMACNDINLANSALTQWVQEPDTNIRKPGAKMYFYRLQLSHLAEGLEILREKEVKPYIKGYICNYADDETKKSYAILEEYLPGGSKRNWFNGVVGRLRHNLTFHYDENGKLTRKALKRIKAPLSVQRGTSQEDWYFPMADKIVESIIKHDIFEIPEDENKVEENKKWDEFNNQLRPVFDAFPDFCGEFFWWFTCCSS